MPESSRKSLMLGTAGHVDHGKTALVKMLTGCRTDHLAEEQRRGLTIDLGYAPCPVPGAGVVGIVDVPGHVDFIRNMVAGVQGIDAVIFVVAANDGVMPQTREHLDILALLGVRHGLIALTKVDMVTPERLADTAAEVRAYVQGTFLADAPFCPVSNITGEGFPALTAALHALVAAVQDRGDDGLFRMWVADAFVIQGFGAVVTGIPRTGAVKVGERLRLVPGEHVGRVRRLEVYGEDAAMGRAGECVAINLTDVPGQALVRGSVLCQGESLAPVTMVEAELRLLDFVTAPVKDYTEVHLHVGTAQSMAHLAVLDDQAIYPRRTHFVQLRLADALGIAPGDRFVIRAALPGAMLTTVGGGRILGVSNLRLRRQRPWTLAALARRAATLDTPNAWVAALLEEAKAPLPPATLAAQAFLPLPRVQALLAELIRDEIVVPLDRQVVHVSVLEEAGARVLAALAQHHATHPESHGAGEADLQQSTGIERHLFALVLARLLAKQRLARRGSVLALPAHQAQVTSADQAQLQQVADLYANAGLTPPDDEAVPAQLNLPPARVRQLLQRLTEEGVLFLLAPGLRMHRDAVAAARRTAIRLFPAFTTMDFRDALGVSRKYAVPLLDYFDSQRLTVRNGNRRTPGMAVKK